MATRTGRCGSWARCWGSVTCSSRVWRRAVRSSPRIHFMPTYASWLNQVELWFGKIERDVLARGIFSSISDLARDSTLHQVLRRQPEADPLDLQRSSESNDYRLSSLRSTSWRGRAPPRRLHRRTSTCSNRALGDDHRSSEGGVHACCDARPPDTACCCISLIRQRIPAASKSLITVLLHLPGLTRGEMRCSLSRGRVKLIHCRE